MPAKIKTAKPVTLSSSVVRFLPESVAVAPVGCWPRADASTCFDMCSSGWHALEGRDSGEPRPSRACHTSSVPDSFHVIRSLVLVADDERVGGQLDDRLGHRVVLARFVIGGGQEEALAVDADRLVGDHFLAALGPGGEGATIAA